MPNGHVKVGSTGGWPADGKVGALCTEARRAGETAGRTEAVARPVARALRGPCGFCVCRRGGMRSIALRRVCSRAVRSLCALETLTQRF